MNTRTFLILLFAVVMVCLPFVLANPDSELVPPNRTEVVFWHFWGGQDKAIVDGVVSRFNQSQTNYFVRAVAMPGNNLQAKLFLSVAGGDPPDLVNQDDPILADWSRRGMIHALDEIVDPAEVKQIEGWMLDSARRLSVIDDRMFGVCNGLDIRALYYNQSALDSKNLSPPRTIAELNAIASAFTPASRSGRRAMYGFLPDSRRIWAWGYVFGGDFVDKTTGRVDITTPPIESALEWMTSYPRRYGADEVASFRQGDQSLPGKTFPLLPLLDHEKTGRYVIVMDGQWRVRDISAFQTRRREQGLAAIEFGVCPLPVPTESHDGVSPRANAGWVNGNFFVVPRGAKNAPGAWEFMKFWIGYTDAGQAARTCSEGGWIPVSSEVTGHPTFIRFLESNPLFTTFVELAASPHQYPIPQVPGAAMFRRTVENAAYQAMAHPDQPALKFLSEAKSRIQDHLDRAGKVTPGHQTRAATTGISK